MPSLSVSAASAAAVCLDPARSISACSHYSIPANDTCFLSTASHRSISDCIAIYRATVFYLRRMYVSIVSNPASALAASAEVYYHFQSSLLHGIRNVSHRYTWYWKTPQDPSRARGGGKPHVSAPKRSTDWTTALKKNPDTHSLTHSLISIIDILLQNRPRLFKIPDHHQPVIIHRRYHSP